MCFKFYLSEKQIDNVCIFVDLSKFGEVSQYIDKWMPQKDVAYKYFAFKDIFYNKVCKLICRNADLEDAQLY